MNSLSMKPLNSHKPLVPSPRMGQRINKDGTRSRSVNGCWTCRLRRKKCDEAGPECLVCRERGLHCAGFGALKPSWMDGGAQQEAVHQDIKATVATVTRMKRMMKLVKSREKVSPPLRSLSIPSGFLESSTSSLPFQDSCSSGVPSRAASLGPSSSFSTQNQQEWAPEASLDWRLNGTFNMLPFNTGQGNIDPVHNPLHNSMMEYSFPPQDLPTDAPTCYPPPEVNQQDVYSYYTPDLVSYASPYAVSGDTMGYLITSQGPALATPPAIIPDGPHLPSAPSRLQQVYSSQDEAINGQIIHSDPSFLETSPGMVSNSPVSEQSSLWAPETHNGTLVSSSPQIQDLRFSNQLDSQPLFAGIDPNDFKHQSIPIDQSAITGQLGYRWP